MGPDVESRVPLQNGIFRYTTLALEDPPCACDEKTGRKSTKEPSNEQVGRCWAVSGREIDRRR